MAQIVQVQSGKTQVRLPDLVTHESLEKILLTDAQFDSLSTDSFTATVTDLGIIKDEPASLAKAIGDADTLRTIIVTQASVEAVGLSAIAAMLQPVPRHAEGGLLVELVPLEGAHAPRTDAACRLQPALDLFGQVRRHRREGGEQVVDRFVPGGAAPDRKSVV